MATHTTASVVANSRTPESVAILVENPGTLDDPLLTVSQATLLAQLLEGPLKARLARTADWSVFNAPTGPIGLDDVIRLTALAGGLNQEMLPPNNVVTLQFLAAGMAFSIFYDAGDGAAACDLLIEMRLVHSNER
jgi:hypothetical protein